MDVYRAYELDSYHILNLTAWSASRPAIGVSCYFPPLISQRHTPKNEDSMCKAAVDIWKQAITIIILERAWVVLEWGCEGTK